MLVINLWGAPSSGKSTTAAGLFFLMKINKYRVELVSEFAKELVLEKRENVFSDQNFIFAEQNRRLRRLEDHGYTFAITDSPLLLPLYYDGGNTGNAFDQFASREMEKYNNLHYFLVRRHTFEAIGRRHNEEQSIYIENDLREFMTKRQMAFTEIEAGPKTPEIILKDIKAREQNDVEHMPFDLSDKNLS